MSLLPLSGFLLLAVSLSTVACTQNTNTLFLANATAARLADDFVAVTVTVQCDGDCTAEASHCAQVTWQNEAGVTPVVLDVSETCAATPLAAGGTESLVVTTKAPLPHGASIMGMVQLVDTSGDPEPGGTTPLGAGETTEVEVSDP